MRDSARRVGGAARALRDLRGLAPVRRLEWAALNDAEELRRRHRADIREEEPRLVGIGCEPEFAIGQRALLVEHTLWDCVPLLDGMAEEVETRGGITAIAISHPVRRSAERYIAALGR